MKLTLILLTAAFINVHATGFSQAITLSGKNLSLKEVFTAIKKQTGYFVFYNQGTLTNTRPVTISVSNVRLVDFLEVVLRDQPFSSVIEGKTITLTPKPAAVPAGGQKADEYADLLMPPAIVTGVIRNATGEILSNVSIRVKGSSSGTFSNAQGVFWLGNLAENAVLQISILGYETLDIGVRKAAGGYTAYAVNKDQSDALKITAGPTISINITMKKKDHEMDDVVITGYMNVNKDNYVGSVFSVKAEAIKIGGEISIDQMLQGVVPGMLVTVNSGQVGATPKIRIRGTSTILGNQEPVWVVDGVIQRDPLPIPNGNGSLAGDVSELRTIASNSISWLNPNDIETITVLKDASATAIYGSQAANGVIVLTTKKARPGQLSVSYNGDYSVGQRPRYSTYDLMNSQELMQFSKEIYAARDSYTQDILPVGYGGLIQQLQSKQIDYPTYIERYRKLENNNTDWFDLLFRNAFNQNHGISISGGSDKIVNRTSLNMQKQAGEAKGNDLLSLAATSNTTLRFGKRLSVNFMLNGTIRETDGFAYGVSPFNYAYNTSRTIPMYNDDGTLFYHEKRGLTSTAIPGKASYLYNVRNEINNTGNRNTSTTLSANTDVRLQLFKGLEYQGLVSYSTASSMVKSYATELSYIMTQERGYEFGTVLSNSPQELASRLPFGGLAQQENARTKSFTLRNSLVFNRVLKEVHFVTVQGGIEARSSVQGGNSDSRYGYLRYRGETYAPVPLAPVALGATQANLIEAMRLNSRIVNKESNYLSEYFSAVYSFDQRYVINVNGRLDASNRFGQDRNKRFQPTWSIGGKWRVANEKFVKMPNWLNNLDFSATYGYQGNTVEAVSPYLIATDGGLSSIFKQYTLNIKSLPYPDLGWERTNTWNLAADINMFNGRVSATVNWFSKKSNILASREVPVENGMNSAIVFGSKMVNSGYDFIVNFIPVQNKNVTWQFSLNSSRVKNVLKENQRVNTRADFLNGSAIVNGEAYSTFYSFDFAGLNPQNGQARFNKMDIKPTNNDLDYLVKSGKTDPDFFGGFNTMVRYKNISLRTQFAMAFGNQKRLPVYYNTSGAPTPEQNAPRILKHRWQQPGDELYTDIPSVPAGNSNRLNVNLPLITFALPLSSYTMYNQSDIMVADADFIRCRTIGMTYEFQQSILKKLHIKRMGATASLTNPFLITFDKKWRGYDPETAAWPARRMASLALSITF